MSHQPLLYLPSCPVPTTFPIIRASTIPLYNDKLLGALNTSARPLSRWSAYRSTMIVNGQTARGHSPRACKTLEH